MNLKQMLSTLEAVLFAVGEPIERDRIAQALEWDALILDQLLDTLQAKYDENDAGVCLLRLDDRVQLCARKEYADSIRKVLEVKRNAPLSQAAFEVLAIIAYNQPVTKSFIEQIRGVDCSAVLSSLVSKGYIVLLIKIFYRVIGLDVIVRMRVNNVLFVFGLAGIIIGSLKAIREKDIRRMVSFSSVAQIGYIFMGIGMGTEAGMVAAVGSTLAPILRLVVSTLSLKLAAAVLEPVADAGVAWIIASYGALHKLLLAICVSGTLLAVLLLGACLSLTGG